MPRTTATISQRTPKAERKNMLWEAAKKRERSGSYRKVAGTITA
jgi:hypothetical protein